MTTTRRDRPLPVTIIGWLFVCVGCGSLASGIWRYAAPPGTSTSLGGSQHLVDLGLVVLSACAAAAGGVFTLRRHNWARWLLIFWMGAHVLLGLAHSPVKLAVHGVAFAIVLAALASPRASSYFRQ
jgi:hypothetical protein